MRGGRCLGVVPVGAGLPLGELGATLVLYPPDWHPVPARIFGLTDRGLSFLAAASTVILLATTLGESPLSGSLREGPPSAERCRHNAGQENGAATPGTGHVSRGVQV